MEKAKKTTKTPETSKAKTTRRVKTPEVKPTTIQLDQQLPKKNTTSPEVSCSHKKGIHCLLFLFLILNLALGIFVVIKIMELQNWILMGTGGEANFRRLEAIYATPQYQDFF